MMQINKKSLRRICINVIANATQEILMFTRILEELEEDDES
jgi:hypothetical protein